ncbi:hypothetical protein GWK47_050442 [Chionoecetes opilio]|uniref:Uncharacterized protein n=1 Tax=Chionoecetes opilio TaxID=41210 RepID=A0A8J5CST6_CHIOP|nr:hypothetical protein GWK47_050442 [Chionoecetes opilio]
MGILTSLSAIGLSHMVLIPPVPMFQIARFKVNQFQRGENPMVQTLKKGNNREPKFIMCMMTSTRERAWWLIGHPECEITRASCPLKGRCSASFYFHHGIDKKTQTNGRQGGDRGSPLDLGEGRVPDLRSPNRQGEAPQPGGQVRVPSKNIGKGHPRPPG